MESSSNPAGDPLLSHRVQTCKLAVPAPSALAPQLFREELSHPYASLDFPWRPRQTAAATRIMNYKPLGNSGISASIVGLGTWVLGGGQLWGQDTDDAESIRTIQEVIDLGINLIDTAPAYGFGRSEVVVGKAIKGRRDKVVIATKCGLWWEDTRGSFFADFDGKKIYRSLREDPLRIEIENSLKRLGVDCI